VIAALLVLVAVFVVGFLLWNELTRYLDEKLEEALSADEQEQTAREHAHPNGNVEILADRRQQR
jgi:flagellar biosynthesis/type III secretory pathway M-ring protein FliF/YscJ